MKRLCAYHCNVPAPPPHPIDWDLNFIKLNVPWLGIYNPCKSLERPHTFPTSSLQFVLYPRLVFHTVEIVVLDPKIFLDGNLVHLNVF